MKVARRIGTAVVVMIAASLLGCSEAEAPVDQAKSDLCERELPSLWMPPTPGPPAEEELDRYNQHADALANAGHHEDAARVRAALEDLEVALAETEMSIFLDKDTTRQERREIEDTLIAHGIKQWRYVSSLTSLKEFKATFPNRPELWENLRPDSLPAAYRTTVTKHSLDQLTEDLEDLPATDEIRTSGAIAERVAIMVVLYEICDQPQPKELRRFLKILRREGTDELSVAG